MTATTGDIRAGLCVINKTGIVHKVLFGEAGCNDVRQARVRRFVSTNQCLVYGLTHCRTCLTADEYHRLVHRPGRKELRS